MNIAITGGAGFIGSNLTEMLLDKGHKVFVIDNYATGRRDNLDAARAGLQIVESDIAQSVAVENFFDLASPELVIHCAASYKDPENWQMDSQTNVIGTVNVVKNAQRKKVGRFIYFQTALCYGNFPKHLPVTLDHPINPECSYAISKTAAEQYIALSGLEFISFRLANIFGPRNLSGPIPTFFGRLSSGKKCFAVNTRRDFIFVRDLVDIVSMAVDGKGSRGYYHVSSGSDYSIKEIYDAVTAAMGIDQPVEERERGADDAPTILLDPSRTHKDFNWKSTTPIREGIAKAVQWYQTHGVTDTYTHLKLKD